MPPLRSNEDLDAHLTQMRVVNKSFEFPLIDFWDPDTLAALENLHERRGRIVGTIGAYRAEYFPGKDLAVRLDILIAESGTRIAQDASREASVLTTLKERLAKPPAA